MSSSIRDHIRSNVVGYVAVFLALTAVTYAAGLAPNSVRSPNIKNGQVKRADLGKNAVNSIKVKNNSLTGADVKESKLAQVPSALNADLLGGQPASAFQQRVTGTCSGAQSVQSIATDGTVGCGSPAGSGTVTNIASGTGLSGGPITSTGTLSVGSSYRLPQSCTANQVAKSNGSGVWTCAADNAGGAPSGAATGDLTGSYPAPTLANGSVSGGTGGKITDNSVTGADVDESTLDSTVIQKRITGLPCSAGQAVTNVVAGGAATCAAAPGPAAYVASDAATITVNNNTNPAGDDIITKQLPAGTYLITTTARFQAIESTPTGVFRCHLGTTAAIGADFDRFTLAMQPNFVGGYFGEYLASATEVLTLPSAATVRWRCWNEVTTGGSAMYRRLVAIPLGSLG